MAHPTDKFGEVRLLQFSDLHLFGDPNGELLGMNTRRSMRAVFEQALRADFTPHAILATGDLTQDPTPAAYAAVRDGFDEFAAAMRSRASRPDIPVYSLAGNHDDSRLMDQTLVGGPMRGTKAFMVGSWRVVLLDSSVPDEVHGFLTDSELHRLDRELASHPDGFSLVCLHHHPVPMSNAWMSDIGLRNSEAFFSVIDRHRGVRGVVWGHVHQEFESVRDRVRLFAAPSTCFQFKPGTESFALDDAAPGYRWLRLLSDGGIRTEVVRVENFTYDNDLSYKGGY